MGKVRNSKEFASSGMRRESLRVSNDSRANGGGASVRISGGDGVVYQEEDSMIDGRCFAAVEADMTHDSSSSDILEAQFFSQSPKHCSQQNQELDEFAMLEVRANSIQTFDFLHRFWIQFNPPTYM